jgi:hypothetical protein
MRIDQQRRLIGAVGQIETARHLTVRPRHCKVALTGERYRAFAEEGADPVDRGAHLGKRGLRAVGGDEAAFLQQPAGSNQLGIDLRRRIVHRHTPPLAIRRRAPARRWA